MKHTRTRNGHAASTFDSRGLRPDPAPAPGRESLDGTAEPRRVERPLIEPKALPRPTHDQIERRAYELFLARAGQNGSAHEDWLRAESELSGADQAGI
jgi:hypothetical protein